MAVKYKKNGTWYDISSSSNNAVDAVENGNLNPVTSNAVYDELNTVATNVLTITDLATNVTVMELQSCRLGKVVDVKFRLHIPANTFAANTDVIVGKVNLKPVISERFIWQNSPYFDSWISTDGNIHIFMGSSVAASGIEPFFCHPYLTND